MAEESGVPVAYLRTIEDSDRLKAAFGEGKRIAVVGAGWIGLEVAAAAREAGCDVTVFETAELPLLRVLGPTVAEVFAGLHREHGVDLRLGATVLAGRPVRSRPRRGRHRGHPRLDLARCGGLAVEDGVLVDAMLRTSVPSVLAVGDIASHAHPVLGRRMRVEHWDTAINQAKTAAHNLAGGDEAYDAMPYFFTDQYDLGMEYVGHGSADDEVVVHGDLGVEGVPRVLGPRGPGRRRDARQRLGRDRRPARRRGLRRAARQGLTGPSRGDGIGSGRTSFAVPIDDPSRV